MQDYQNKELLIYNNAEIPIEIDTIPNVTLINNHLDYVTGESYKDVGSVFRDALMHVNNDVDYVSFMDDDDIYLPQHYSNAVKDLDANEDVAAWKPGYYFFKSSPTDVELKICDNSLEGASVVRLSYLKEKRI